MSHLRDLVDDLRVLVPVAAFGNSVMIDGDPSYVKLKELLQSVLDSPELDMLSPEELRALTSFRITLYRASQMEASMARKHIAAIWRGAAKQALLKLSVGQEAEAAMRALMAGGIG